MSRFIAILVTCVLCATSALAAKSVIVDPSLAYYKERSAESIVEELKANEYKDVRLSCVNESRIDGALVKAFAGAEMKPWMLTFVNGVYSTADLPKGWESWRMKLKEAAHTGSFTYLCINNPDYLKWKKTRITEALSTHQFWGIDLAEPFFPGYPGPKGDTYGCFCDSCKAAFASMYPDAGGTPDFTNPASPHYWRTDTTLYEKWVGFRVSSVVNFLDALVNGKDGIREKCPAVKVATWSLGLDSQMALMKLREYEGVDGAAIVKRVKPDMHVIQTDWPDWTKPGLSGKYPLSYKPIADSIRAVSPGLPLMLQTDIGSKQDVRRNSAWINDVESAAKEIGCDSLTCYEYSLGDYIYTGLPEIMDAKADSRTVTLVFNKRLESISASNLLNYTISSGQLDYAKVDGNLVKLSVSGLSLPVTVVVSNISDDESRRLFHDKPRLTMERSQQVTVNATEEEGK